MKKAQIKKLLPPSFECHVDLYGTSKYLHTVFVKSGTKQEAMNIINSNGGKARAIICSEVYSDVFVVEK